jgi:hypothetical protein
LDWSETFLITNDLGSPTMEAFFVDSGRNPSELIQMLWFCALAVAAPNANNAKMSSNKFFIWFSF